MAAAALEDLMQRQQFILSTIVKIPEIAANNFYNSLDMGGVYAPFPLIPINDPDLCCVGDPERSLSAKKGSLCGSSKIVADGDGFILTWGRTTLRVETTEINDAHVIYRSRLPPSMEYLNTKMPALEECLLGPASPESIRLIGADKFTNRILIAYILNYIFRLYSAPPLYVEYYWSSQCANVPVSQLTEEADFRGMMLTEYCDLGPLGDFLGSEKSSPYRVIADVKDVGIDQKLEVIRPEILYEVLKQTSLTLQFLQRNIQFSTGGILPNGFMVKSQDIRTSYQGVTLEAPFTCKIANFSEASCLVKAENDYLRFHPHLREIDTFATTQPFQFIATKAAGDLYYFWIGASFDLLVYERGRLLGMPFYSSFDFYTFLVTLLLIPAVYYSFFSTPWLRAIFWDPLWIDTDGQVAQSRIRYRMINGTTATFAVAVDILRNLALTCSAANRVIDANRTYTEGGDIISASIPIPTLDEADIDPTLRRASDASCGSLQPIVSL